MPVKPFVLGQLGRVGVEIPGKDERGHYTKGNKAAVGAKGGGNPLHRRRGELNRALAEAITPEDITNVIKAMVAAAVEDHDAVAAKIVLDRGLGRLEAELKIKRGDADEVEVERRLGQRMRVFALALSEEFADEPEIQARIAQRVRECGPLLDVEVTDDGRSHEDGMPDRPIDDDDASRL